MSTNQHLPSDVLRFLEDDSSGIVAIVEPKPYKGSLDRICRNFSKNAHNIIDPFYGCYGIDLNPYIFNLMIEPIKDMIKDSIYQDSRDCLCITIDIYLSKKSIVTSYRRDTVAGDASDILSLDLSRRGMRHAVADLIYLDESEKTLYLGVLTSKLRQ